MNFKTGELFSNMFVGIDGEWRRPQALGGDGGGQQEAAVRDDEGQKWDQGDQVPDGEDL